MRGAEVWCEKEQSQRGNYTGGNTLSDMPEQCESSKGPEETKCGSHFETRPNERKNLSLKRCAHKQPHGNLRHPTCLCLPTIHITVVTEMNGTQLQSHNTALELGSTRRMFVFSENNFGILDCFTQIQMENISV